MITATPPATLLRTRLKVNKSKIGSALWKGLLGAVTQSPISGGAAVLDGVAAFEKVVSAGELGWLLVTRALSRCFHERKALEALPPEIERDAIARFRSAIPDFLSDRSWLLTKEILESPASMEVFREVSETFHAFLLAELIPLSVADRARAAVHEYIATALANEWKSRPEYEKVATALNHPFSDAESHELAWSHYHARLALETSKRVFDESFSLRDIYVPLRAQSAMSPPEDAHHLVSRWLDDAQGDDFLRVLSGGPGSGKSSFVLTLAASLAAGSDISVLFVPLHLLPSATNFVDAINAFASQTEAPVDPLTTFSRSRLLLIFDGVDELEMQGRFGAEVAQEFVAELTKFLRNVNAHALRVLAIVTGREVLLQNLNAVLAPSHVLLILPLYNGDTSDLDQRHEWWRKYGQLKGRPYGGLPEKLNRKELVELTGQPLLNYLVALSYERDKLNFDGEPSLHDLYADIVDAVYDRKWAVAPHPAVKRLSKDEYLITLCEIAATVSEGNGKTATLAQLAERFRSRHLEHLLTTYVQSAERGLDQFLTSFYFRYRHPRVRDGKTFEFTHKTFGEHLLAQALIRFAEAIASGPEHDYASQWAKLVGPIRLDRYTLRFLREAIAALSDARRKALADACVSILEDAIVNGFPMLIAGGAESILRIQNAFAANAGTAALAFLSAIGASESRRIRIETIEHFGFAEWLHETAGHRGRNTDPIVLRCLTHVELDRCSFANLDLWGANLSQSRFREARFDNSILTNADLTWCDLERAAFEGTFARSACFDHANLRGTQAAKAVFSGAHMRKVNFNDATLSETAFDGVTMHGASFRKADIRNCTFHSAVLIGGDFTDSVIRGRLLNADLRSARFTKADLRHATIEGCNLEGAIFDETRVWPSTFAGTKLSTEQEGSLVRESDLPTEWQSPPAS